MQRNHYYQSLKQRYHLHTNEERRLLVINEMSTLEKNSIHCQSCPGTCCTQVANSMKITPLEAFEILMSLEQELIQPELKSAWISKWKKTVEDYRLDKEIYTGKKHSQSLRKNYTCPFFNHNKLGCGLSRKSKPYGCLGFNPKQNDDNGKTCTSLTEILTKRDDHFIAKENLTNGQIKKDFNLTWDKQNIPMGLLDLVNHLYD